MPNIKSAKKRMLTSEAAHKRNKAVRTRVTSIRRSFMEAIETKDAEKSNSIYKTYCSVLDKAAKGGVIKKNTAVRRKTRAAEQLRKLG